MMLSPSPVLIGAAAIATSGESLVIIGDNPVLRAWCIIGAILGGWLSIAVFPIAELDTTKVVRRLAIKWSASTIIGYIVTPIFVRHYSIAPISDNLLFISCAFGFSGVSLLHIVFPRVQSWVKKRMDKWMAD